MISPVFAALGSPRVAGLFVAWMQAVEASSRRVLLIHCPHAPDMSADEQRLIAACGAAPVTEALGEILLQPLLLDCAAVMGLGKALNAALAIEGYPLPARLTILPFESARVAGPTLH